MLSYIYIRPCLGVQVSENPIVPSKQNCLPGGRLCALALNRSQRSMEPRASHDRGVGLADRCGGSCPWPIEAAWALAPGRPRASEAATRSAQPAQRAFCGSSASRRDCGACVWPSRPAHVPSQPLFFLFFFSFPFNSLPRWSYKLAH
jgi:hypothetical protein